MQKSFIIVNSRDVNTGELRAMLQTQLQIARLTEMVEDMRSNKTDMDKSYSEKILSEVKNIIS